MEAEILEGNRLIAEFMGAEFKKVDYFGNGKITDEIIFKDHPSHIISCRRTFSNFYDLKYHSSWDWLMPVWVKFKNLSFKEISEKHYHKQVCASFGNAILIGEIKKSFYDAVMAVKWYNLNK